MTARVKPFIHIDRKVSTPALVVGRVRVPLSVIGPVYGLSVLVSFIVGSVLAFVLGHWDENMHGYPEFGYLIPFAVLSVMGIIWCLGLFVSWVAREFREAADEA